VAELLGQTLDLAADCDNKPVDIAIVEPTVTRGQLGEQPCGRAAQRSP